MKRGSETDNEQVKRPKPESEHTIPGRPSTGGKHPVTAGGAKPPAAPAQVRPSAGGKHPPVSGGKHPSMGGKHPPGGKQPGRGGKQPGAGGKQPGTGGTEPENRKPPNVGGKQPASFQTSGVTQRPPVQRPPQQPPPPSGAGAATVGGKQPAAYQQVLAESEPKQTKQIKPKAKQPTVHQPPPQQPQRPPASRPPAQPHARSGRQVKQHPYVGKRVKVFYIDEGYHGGIVKSVNETTREFIIIWDDGSTSGVTLNEEDETDNSENEDRWSVVEEIPYEQPENGLQKARGGSRPLSYSDSDT